MSNAASLTALLQAARDGDAAAAQAIWPVIYPELRRIAHARLRGPGAQHAASAPLAAVSDGPTHQHVRWIGPAGA